jgi:hypothetical protein
MAPFSSPSNTRELSQRGVANMKRPSRSLVPHISARSEGGQWTTLIGEPPDYLYSVRDVDIDAIVEA